jgi:tRNA dimethylallyltransferase
LIKRNTRRYAKRQVTWFKADKRIRWFKVKNEDDLEKIAEKVQVQVQE